MISGRAYGYERARLSQLHRYLEGPLLRALSARTWEPGARVLDFGCGSGALSGWLAERGFDPVGLDISETGVEVARQAFPDLQFSNDVSADGLAALGPFDLATCIEVIAHCYEPHAELSKIFEALRPGACSSCRSLITAT